MTVLSDNTIRELMRGGSLVIGEENRAVHCSYEFLPGKIFPGGHHSDDKYVVDWTDVATRNSNGRYTIEPAAVVWVRTLHTVRLPNNVCGLWTQTNTLSRQGLMLINSSLVEPGYEGFLSCNFVNFGKDPVYLTPDTPIAKLLFLKLDCDALVSFDKRFPQYDNMISGIASRGPSSFLQISEMTTTLEDEKRRALEEIDQQAKERSSHLDQEKKVLLAGVQLDIQKAREKELQSLKEDFDRYFKKALGVGAVALLVVAAVAWISDFARGKLSNDSLKKSEAETLVEKEVTKRLEALRMMSFAPQPLQPSLIQQQQTSPIPTPDAASPPPVPPPPPSDSN